MKIRTAVIMALVLAGVAYATGRYLQPAEVKIKTEVKTEVVEVEVEKVRTEVRTIVREITKPDGTVIREEVTENIDENTNVTKNEENTQIKKEKQVLNLKPQWKVQAQVGTDIDFTGELSYRIGVERRIIGPVFGGVYANTNLQEVGLSISMEF